MGHVPLHSAGRGRPTADSCHPQVAKAARQLAEEFRGRVSGEVPAVREPPRPLRSHFRQEQEQQRGREGEGGADGWIAVYSTRDDPIGGRLRPRGVVMALSDADVQLLEDSEEEEEEAPAAAAAGGQRATRGNRRKQAIESGKRAIALWLGPSAGVLPSTPQACIPACRERRRRGLARQPRRRRRRRGGGAESPEEQEAGPKEEASPLFRR